MSAEDYDMMSDGEITEECYSPSREEEDTPSHENVYWDGIFPPLKEKCCNDIFESIVHRHDLCFLNYLNSYYTNIDYYDPDFQGTALDYAIGTGNVYYSLMIIKHGANLYEEDGEGNNILSRYILNSYMEFGSLLELDIIHMLLDHGVKIQERVIIALLRMEEYKIIHLFVRRGMNPSYIEALAEREGIHLAIDMGVDDIIGLCKNMTVS